ncbi:MAG: alpha-amylase family glycosyl hydrolase [Pyrinomonadaceae bacterium]
MPKANPQGIAESEPFAFLCAFHCVCGGLIFRLAICSCFLASFLGISASSQTNLPSVTKVEPPSWWARHSINPIRLLVRGNNLAGARVASTNGAIQTPRVLVNPRGTYLFVDVRIGPAARPGSYPLTLITAQGNTTIPFRIEATLAATTHFQGVTPDDVIYLIMPDRFADGDQANNTPPNAPAAANDRKNPRAYHGGDLRGVINHLPYLKDLGVTALWLNPWYDNWNGVNNCDKPWCPNTYYHGYHAIDYYAVEDRFGDMATLLELVEQAHALGLKVIQDQVANHVGSRHPWVTDPPLDDWFHGTLAHHTVNRFNNSALLSPHANRDEFRNTLDGWFSDDLPDMNQEEPEVARYEIQNALWWIGATGIDGIRQDTIQYLPRSFIRDLSNALHRQYPKMWMVGEVFDHDAAHTSFFIGDHKGWDGTDTKLDSVFDFPLWNASRLAFTGKAPLRALRDQLKYDALYPDPSRLTVFANNHDTARFMSLDGATLEGAMMHVAFTLSVRGIPQLYYGEEIAMEGKDDPDNRRDFPGGFPGDPRNAFDASGRRPKEQKMFEWTRSWIRLRAEHSALRSGNLTDLFYDDDTYVFARQDRNETVIVAFNRADKEKKITVSAGSIGLKDGAALDVLIGTATQTHVAKGQTMLTLAKNSASSFIVR